MYLAAVHGFGDLDVHPILGIIEPNMCVVCELTQPNYRQEHPNWLLGGTLTPFLEGRKLARLARARRFLMVPPMFLGVA